MKKALSVLLAVLLLVSAFSLCAYAEGETVEITSFEANVNYDNILLTADHTEGEVKKMIENNFEITIEGSKEERADLMYLLESWNGISHGTTQVQLDRNYAVCLYCELKEGYKWPDEILALPTLTHYSISEFENFKVVINGEEREDATIMFNTYWKGVTVYIPMDKAAEHDPEPEPIVFPDVKETDWFYDVVQYVAKKGFIKGYQDGKFGPNDSLKRQDFVCILARIDGADLSAYENQTSKLSDVKKGDYYAAAVNWAVDKGYISGYQNGKFGVNDSITREQVAIILYNYMDKPEVENAEKILAKFPDANKVSSFAKIPVAWAVSNGVISGMGNGTVASTSGATRAQIAAIIQRMDTQGMFSK